MEDTKVEDTLSQYLFVIFLMKHINYDINSVCVVGMGYVGLTLTVVLAEVGYKVICIEINEKLVEKLNSGKVHFFERGLEPRFRKQLENGNIIITGNDESAKYDVIVICVATPINKKTFSPIIDYVSNSLKSVSRFIDLGSIVLMRSTVPVGLSRKTVIPKLEEYTGLTVGEDFFFAVTPERTLEGKALSELYHNTQIIGGYSKNCNLKASIFFQKLTSTIVNVSSLEAAEMIKIIDNTYRDVSFANANELALIAEHLSLDAYEIINAANTHYPRNNVPLPSPGVGGACLSKDPHLLIDFSKKAGYNPELIVASRKINESYPARIIRRISSELNNFGKDLNSSTVLIVGLAFKGNPITNDLRDSTSIWLIEELNKNYKCEVKGFDYVVDFEEIKNLGIKPVELPDGFNDLDVLIVGNNHEMYRDWNISDIIGRMDTPSIIYDSWRMIDFADEFDKNDIKYMSPGL